jgi:hypothetical protein
MEEARQGRKLPRVNLTLPETTSLLVGGSAGLSGYSAKAVAPKIMGVVVGSIHVTLREVITAILGIGSGLWVGYYLGHKSKPKPGKPLFLSLLNDEVFWRGVASDHVTLFWWQLAGKKPVTDIWPTIGTDEEVGTFIRAGAHVPKLPSRKRESDSESEAKHRKEWDERMGNGAVFSAFLSGLSDAPNVGWFEYRLHVYSGKK